MAHIWPMMAAVCAGEEVPITGSDVRHEVVAKNGLRHQLYGKVSDFRLTRGCERCGCRCVTFSNLSSKQHNAPFHRIYRPFAHTSKT
jgi:hypothetical protein